MTKTQKIVYYVLLVLISLGFLAASIDKLIGDPNAISGFAVAHLPVWFMYFIGACELLGVIGLWIKKTFLWAAGGLGIILIGAIVVTAIFSSLTEALIPLVYWIILGIIVKLNRKGIASSAMPSSMPQ